MFAIFKEGTSSFVLSICMGGNGFLMLSKCIGGNGFRMFATFKEGTSSFVLSTCIGGNGFRMFAFAIKWQAKKSARIMVAPLRGKLIVFIFESFVWFALQRNKQNSSDV